MRIDETKITRTGNMFTKSEGVNLPNCPRFRAEAEKIVAMLLKVPQPILDDLDEGGAGKLQVRIIAEYWRYYDALDVILAQPMTGSRYIAFREWLANKNTTPPENIRRACQWLVETGIIILKQAVRERSLERAEGIRAGKGG
jgi:hypothetical protein